MSEINMKESELLDDYALRLIDNRVALGLEYSEVYELITGEIYSNDNARKSLYGVRAIVVAKQKNEQGHVEEQLAKLSSKESLEIKADNSHTLERFVLACEEDLKSPDRIMSILGYDPLMWELTGSKTSRWNVSNGTGNGNHKVLYSLRATVKPRKVELDIDKITNIINNLKIDAKKLKNYDYEKGNYILEIPMMDVHFNKISESRIVGVESNSETIKTDFMSVVEYFLAKSHGKKIERIIFPIGQDYFNSEANGTTTHGTPQDNDLPHDLMFEKGTDLLFEAIEMCREIAPVLIQFVAGNHDTNIAYYATSSLSRMYKYNGTSGVEFDLLPKRKYIEFGKCLIGYTHGNKERVRIEKENIMQNEMREAWGRTLFHEWHTGHEHHEEVRELGGIKYRKINSITANDNWHYENGYVGALRMAQAFLWHKEFGLLDIYNCPILN